MTAEEIPNVFDLCLWPHCPQVAGGMLCKVHRAIAGPAIIRELSSAVLRNDQEAWRVAVAKVKALAAARTI